MHTYCYVSVGSRTISEIHKSSPLISLHTHLNDLPLSSLLEPYLTLWFSGNCILGVLFGIQGVLKRL